MEWSDVELAAAFVLGAALATFACVRIVRAVTTIFDGGRRRWGRRPPPDDDAPSQ